MYRRDSDELQAARAQLVSYSARLLADGLAVGSAGNISVRAGDIVAITPSGIGYGDMRPGDACPVEYSWTSSVAVQSARSVIMIAPRSRSTGRRTRVR